MTTKEWDDLIEQTVQEMEEEDRLDLAAGRIPDNDLELIQAKHDAFCKGDDAFAGRCVDVAKVKKFRVLSRSAHWLSEHCESVVGMEETPASQCRPNAMVTLVLPKLADFRYEEYPIFTQMVAAADAVIFAGNSCTIHLSFGIQDVWREER